MKLLGVQDIEGLPSTEIRSVGRWIL